MPKKTIKPAPDGQVRCPACGECYFPDLYNGSGNYQEPCQNCDVEIGFHVEIEIDSVYILDKQPHRTKRRWEG